MLSGRLLRCWRARFGQKYPHSEHELSKTKTSKVKSRCHLYLFQMYSWWFHTFHFLRKMIAARNVMAQHHMFIFITTNSIRKGVLHITSIQKSRVIKLFFFTWTKQNIYEKYSSCSFQISSDTFNSHRNWIRCSMWKLQKETCIRFIFHCRIDRQTEGSEFTRFANFITWYFQMYRSSLRYATVSGTTVQKYEFNMRGF